MNKTGKWLVILHLLILVFSFTGVFSKLAAGEIFLSKKFIVFYACEIVILGIYAIGWQQILKHLPISLAFANKSVGMIWTVMWGIVLFDECLTIGKAIGSFLVLIGSVLFSTDSSANDAKAK